MVQHGIQSVLESVVTVETKEAQTYDHGRSTFDDSVERRIPHGPIYTSLLRVHSTRKKQCQRTRSSHINIGIDVLDSDIVEVLISGAHHLADFLSIGRGLFHNPHAD